MVGQVFSTALMITNSVGRIPEEEGLSIVRSDVVRSEDKVFKGTGADWMSVSFRPSSLCYLSQGGLLTVKFGQGFEGGWSYGVSY